jgi:hypothetical protein
VTRSKLLIPGVLAVVAAVAFWFLVISPKREEIAQLDTDIAAQETAAQQAEQQAVLYAKAKNNYRKNYTTVVRLGKAVPADDDVRSLLVQIDDAASDAKVDFRSMSVSSQAAAPTDPAAATATTPDTLAPAPGSVAVGSAGFSAMPFNFGFTGSFFRLSDFFDHLNKFVTVQNEDVDVTGRLMLVGSIAVTPDQSVQTPNGKLSAQIGAVTYIVPPAQGVTAGASPEAPAGAAPDTGADGTVTTPTATITGVR